MTHTLSNFSPKENVMKYLWTVAVVMLAASVPAYANQPNQSDIEKAMAECQAMADAKTNRTAFDACMKAKGFERPKSS